MNLKSNLTAALLAVISLCLPVSTSLGQSQPEAPGYNSYRQSPPSRQGEGLDRGEESPGKPNPGLTHWVDSLISQTRSGVPLKQQLLTLRESKGDSRESGIVFLTLGIAFTLSALALFLLSLAYFRFARTPGEEMAGCTGILLFGVAILLGLPGLVFLIIGIVSLAAGKRVGQRLRKARKSHGLDSN